MKKRKILVAVIIVFSVIFTSFGYYAYQIIKTPNVVTDMEERSLLIYPGTTFKELQTQLINERFINDPVSFSFLAKLMDYDENIKPGHYLLKKDMSNLQAIRLLRSGQQTPVDVTFNNIRTKKELAARISKNLMAEEGKVYQLLNDQNTAASYGFNEHNFVSMFIPNTYEFFWTTDAGELLERMHKEYQRFWTEERIRKAQQKGLTPQEVSTLASIVQAETSKTDEMPRVAGVYLNRLKRNMRLEADPTLVFAANDFTIKRVLNEHKAIDSPYNTYMYSGLPPGPINLPHISAVDAVLNAENHKFIFFCARPDFSGYHAFATNYSEHLRNARQYQRALNERKVYK